MHWALCYPSFSPYGDRAWDYYQRLNTFPTRDRALNDAAAAKNIPGPADDGEGDSDLDDEDPNRANIRHEHRRDRNRLTERMLWSYHLQERNRVRINDNPNDFEPYENFLLRGHRLTQQLMVHAYSSILANKLNWLRRNNDKFRRDNCAGVVDALLEDNAQDHDENMANNIGCPYILPSSFVGGDRFLHQLFQDTMTYVVEYGPPSISSH